MNVGMSAALVVALLAMASKEVKGFEGMTVPLILTGLALVVLGFTEAILSDVLWRKK